MAKPKDDGDPTESQTQTDAQAAADAAAAKAAQEQADRDAAEKAERDAAAKAAQEQADREAAEKAAADQAQREADEKAAAARAYADRVQGGRVQGLRFFEESALAAHTHHPGLITFPPTDAMNVPPALFADGVYRLSSSAWQFRIAGGRLAQAVRADNVHFVSADETVVEAPVEPIDPA